MSISFSGLVSGLDTASWVDAFVSVRQADVTKIQTQMAAQKSSKAINYYKIYRKKELKSAVEPYKKYLSEKNKIEYSKKMKEIENKYIIE